MSISYTLWSDWHWPFMQWQVTLARPARYDCCGVPGHSKRWIVARLARFLPEITIPLPGGASLPGPLGLPGPGFLRAIGRIFARSKGGKARAWRPKA